MNNRWSRSYRELPFFLVQKAFDELIMGFWMCWKRCLCCFFLFVTTLHLCSFDSRKKKKRISEQDWNHRAGNWFFWSSGVHTPHSVCSDGWLLFRLVLFVFVLRLKIIIKRHLCTLCALCFIAAVQCTRDSFAHPRPHKL